MLIFLVKFCYERKFEERSLKLSFQLRKVREIAFGACFYASNGIKKIFFIK